MREANWDEIFQRRREDEAENESRLSSVIPWEDWLTFAITTLCFMSVVASIDGANWVDEMPSLYPIGFSGLIIGYALSRVRAHELLLHGAAFLAGAALVYLQLIAILPGGSPLARTDELVNRMQAWWTAATQGGISNDTLPFIVLTLTLTWVGSYISAWAIFRWRNPWLGLVPGGVALMWNISFIPGQFSYSFVFFIFGAVLLLMRMHLARKEAEWDRDGIVYPEFISLAALNATFWVTLVMLILVWLMPLAERSESANERWQSFASPVTDRFSPLARVFVGVNAKKPIRVHNIKDALPLQGKIKLNDRDAVQIDVQITPEMAAFLREQSFDEYTSDGWKLNVQGLPLDPGERTDVPGAEDTGGARQEITVNVTVEGGNDEHLFSLGQPVQADEAAEARIGGSPEDISSLEPAQDLDNGDAYTVTGSVSVASADVLRAAGDDYPQWVLERYLSLPDDLPRRVEGRAEEIAGSQDTPYDKAVAIQDYLRTFPRDYNVPAAPAGRDSVDYFLFDVQRGYFDYHASAMAVMLRTLGIPARVATGYYIDPLLREGDTNTFKLTQRQAYAWPEVYFPGGGDGGGDIGWVEFSPSPDRGRISRPGAVTPPSEPIPEDEILREEDPFAFPPITAPIPEAADEGGGGGLAGALPVMLALAIVGAIVVVIAGAGKFAWEFGLGGLPHAGQLWEKTVRLATLGKAGPQTSETPREYARRLRRDVPGADAAGYIEAAYERSRFGQKPLSEEETEPLDAAWSSLRSALLRRALRLKRTK